MAKKAECPLLAVQNKIILRQEEPQKQVGSIVLSDVGAKKRYCGVVVAVGPGKKVASGGECVSLRPDVEVGDFVYFQDYHGGEVEAGGEKFLVIDEDDVLAVRVG